MGNYDDWDPQWRPVGDPVQTDHDSSDYGSSGESAPSESSPPSVETADLPGPEPTLGEAWAELRRQYEAAGLGAGGVAIEPESPDQVVRGWRARLELPDKYGPAELGPDESGTGQPYPDESERAQHRPADVGPTMPTDWASILAATPYGAPRPYEYEPASQPPPENLYTLEEGGKPWTPKVPTISPQPLTFLQSEQQRLKGWESLPQDLSNAWDAFLRFAGLSPNAPAPKPTPALPPNWDQMTPGEKLQWGTANREHAPLIPELVEGGISNMARANEYLAERTPGVGGAEKLVLEDVPEAVGMWPRVIGAAMLMNDPDFVAKEMGISREEAQQLIARNQEISALQRQAEYAATPDAAQAIADRIKELESQPSPITPPEMGLHAFQGGPKAFAERAPAWFQIAEGFVDPGYIALGKVLELPKVASQAGKWEVIKTALESQGMGSHVPIVEQMIEEAGGWGSKGASRVLKEADELLMAPATAAKAREGQGLLLKVLNEYKAEGVEPFTRDNLAGRGDEVKAILDEYASKVKGIDPLKSPQTKRWNTLPQSMKDDISKRSLIDAATGLESRYAYELETKPKGWLHAISDVNGLGAINKRLGEAMGNEVIAKLGRVINAKVKEAGGRAFRYGGDEIKMWFPDEETAQKTLAAIDKEFREIIIERKVPDGPVVRKKGFTISYGYGRDELAADNALNADKLRRTRIGERAGKNDLPGGISEVSSGVGPPGGDQLGDAGRRVSDALEARGGGAQTARAGQVAGPTAAVPLHERWDSLPPSRKEEIGRRALIDAATGLESRFAYELGTKPAGWVDGVAGMNGLAGINEAFGHPAADDLLNAIGKVVKAKAEEEGGRAFRYGGDAIKLWFPDKGSARRAMAAIDQEVKESIFPVTSRDGTVVWKKGFTISYGYGPDEAAAGSALNADKLRRESIGERAPRGVVPPSIVDVPFHSGTTGERNAAAAAALARAGAIGAVAGAARTSDQSSPNNETRYVTPDTHALGGSGAFEADTPRLVLQYMRQQLSNLGYPSAMIDQLKPSEAAQIIAEGRLPKVRDAENPSGQGSGRGAAPGGVGSGRLDAERQSNRRAGRRPVLPQVPLSLSQQMAQLYRGTVAGDGYRGDRRATGHDAWAMVPDDLKAALEDYWQGERLTRAEVQRLMPVYRRYVAQTGDPGDMVEWVTATLREQRYPQRRRGRRAHATTRIAA